MRLFSFKTEEELDLEIDALFDLDQIQADKINTFVLDLNLF